LLFKDRFITIIKGFIKLELNAKISNIIKKALIFKFLYKLLQNLRIKAIKFKAKTKKFNLNNIKTFKEIYKDIENSYTILKDINNLV
jgi:hypothetical protein